MKSIVYDISDKDFRILVKSSSTYKEALEFFGLQNKGNNYVALKRRIKELKIDHGHFLSRIDSSIRTNKVSKEKFINEHLIKGRSLNSMRLKKRLVEFNLLEYRCDKCDNSGTWQGEELSLQLDHINGDNIDNRLENLRFLCPNCHSQTPNFAGKKLKKINKCDCGNVIHNSSKMCRKCAGKIPRVMPTKSGRQKINWPTKEVLDKLVWQKPTMEIAKNLGVSDVAVAKKCKTYGIKKPPRGYWAKIRKNAGVCPSATNRLEG